jgi:hypothetical protein
VSALSPADREWLEKSCVDSGVPVKVTDPIVITRAASVLSAYGRAKTDPRWQAAQARFAADLEPEESANSGLIRRSLAIRDMYEIETEYERKKS